MSQTSIKKKDYLLKRIVEANLETTLNSLQQEKQLPFYIKKEFSELMKCGDPKKGLVRLHCAKCNHNQFHPFSCKRRGLCPSCTTRRMHSTAANLVDFILPKTKVRQWVLSFPFRLRYLQAYDSKVLNSVLRIFYRTTRNYYRKQLRKLDREVGAVTFIQRFGGSLNLNVHFHTLFLEGCYVKDEKGEVSWRELKAPSTEEIDKLNQAISHRVLSFLLRYGYLEEFEEGNYQLQLSETTTLHQEYQNSIMRRKSHGSHRNNKIDSIGKSRHTSWQAPEGNRLSYRDGFSLHANVSVSAKNRNFLERLCRYMGRGAITESRLSQDVEDNILYKLKNNYADGTTHLKFTPEEFLTKLVALIPPPRSHLVRYHGVLAPNSKWRKYVVPGVTSVGTSAPVKRRYWIPWAELLRRVFYDHLTKCERCGNLLKIVDYFVSYLDAIDLIAQEERPPPKVVHLI